MPLTPTSVLHASALLASIHAEPGAEAVTAALAAGAAINLVNWAEVLSVIRREGGSLDQFLGDLTKWKVIGAEGLLTLAGITDMDARVAADVLPLTSHLGLSPGDRLCIATGLRLRLPILTADKLWGRVTVPGLEIRLIR